MLTRLRVSGFKNLIDVDVRFGPFTCVTGGNGVGKSNLFDAILFLSALADRPLADAALSVRNGGGRTTDVRGLFYRAGGQYAEAMSFEAEMIVPGESVDALGQRVTASTTFLRYTVALAFRPDETQRSAGRLEILREELDHINIGEATKHLLFPNKPVWRRSVVHGRRAMPFISTEGAGADRVIVLHQDGSGGGPIARSAAPLPRTVLSVANTAATPTALLARREMQSWRLLHLEPSALRQPDELAASTRLGPAGAHLPSALYHFAAQHARQEGIPEEEAADRVYRRVTDRLSTLIEEVSAVWVDRDQRREMLTLYTADRSGTAHPARALSDGTLRFLALAVLAQDPDASGLLCLEEPENGIHPERIPAMIRLAQDLATDTTEPVGPANPLRQVIVNTHSPAVIREMADDRLLIAERRPDAMNGQKPARLVFSCLRETWRQKAQEAVHTVPRDQLAAYLHLPSLPAAEDAEAAGKEPVREEKPDLQLPLFGGA
jgi:predicted ATPase